MSTKKTQWSPAKKQFNRSGHQHGYKIIPEVGGMTEATFACGCPGYLGHGIDGTTGLLYYQKIIQRKDVFKAA